MESTKTDRGFAVIRFKDSNGIVCTIQESSSAMESKIWIGAEDIGLKRFTKGLGWQDIKLVNTIEDHFVANNRMHLTCDQVKELLPILQTFVETGGLP